MAEPAVLSPDHRTTSLISPSLNLTAVMQTTLLEDNTLVLLGKNNVPGGWHTGRQTGRTCGTRFAQIPCIIRQVQQLTFPFETIIATYARPLLLLDIRLKPPA
jgi:hypothetical protein